MLSKDFLRHVNAASSTEDITKSEVITKLRVIRIREWAAEVSRHAYGAGTFNVSEGSVLKSKPRGTNQNHHPDGNATSDAFKKQVRYISKNHDAQVSYVSPAHHLQVNKLPHTADQTDVCEGVPYSA